MASCTLISPRSTGPGSPDGAVEISSVCGCFDAHFGDDFIQLAADRPVGFAGLTLHLFDVAVFADEDFKELQAFRREAKKWGKLELANDARAVRGAI